MKLRPLLFLCLCLLPCFLIGQDAITKAQKQLNKLDALVDLTPQQEENILPIMISFHEKMMKLRSSDISYIKKMRKQGMNSEEALSASKQNFKSERKKLNDERINSIRPILTEEQINIIQNRN